MSAVIATTRLNRTMAICLLLCVAALTGCAQTPNEAAHMAADAPPPSLREMLAKKNQLIVQVSDHIADVHADQAALSLDYVQAQVNASSPPAQGAVIEVRNGELISQRTVLDESEVKPCCERFDDLVDRMQHTLKERDLKSTLETFIFVNGEPQIDFAYRLPPGAAQPSLAIGSGNQTISINGAADALKTAQTVATGLHAVQAVIDEHKHGGRKDAHS